jgi:hypothetical protein
VNGVVAGSNISSLRSSSSLLSLNHFKYLITTYSYLSLLSFFTIEQTNIYFLKGLGSHNLAHILSGCVSNFGRLTEALNLLVCITRLFLPITDSYWIANNFWVGRGQMVFQERTTLFHSCSIDD